MPEEKQESSGFKVVDRRLFSEDGEKRHGATEGATERFTAPQIPPPAAAPPPTPERATPADVAPPEPIEDEVGGFKGVVQFLGTTALFQLGLMQGPSGETIPADLVSARHTIDMLEVLDRKTRGNLTQEESRLLEDVLYELRMSFIELEKRHMKKSR
jgi:Domain of unknown function (DUF1844)